MRKSILLAVLVSFSMSFAHAQILAVEGDALIALFNSTDRAGWTT